MNRSLAVKFDRAKAQRIEAGMAEGNKLAYRTNKSAAREIIAACQLVPKNCNAPLPEKVEPVMVMYRPAIVRRKAPWQTWVVDCGPELIKRAK